MSRFDDLLTDDDLRTKREPLKEPAKTWLNWWRSPNTHCGHCVVCGQGQAYTKGEVFASHCGVHPSKDAAETRAMELLALQAKLGFEQDEYLGAYPVEN